MHQGGQQSCPTRPELCVAPAIMLFGFVSTMLPAALQEASPGMALSGVTSWARPRMGQEQTAQAWQTWPCVCAGTWLGHLRVWAGTTEGGGTEGCVLELSAPGLVHCGWSSSRSADL